MSKTYHARRTAIAVAAAGLLLASVTPSVAAGVTPVNGIYYTTELVTSLTPTGGAAQADCDAAYLPAGTQIVATTVLNLSGTVPQVNVRTTQPTASPPGLILVHQVLAPAKGSTFTNQSGTITEYADGQKFLVLPYTATATVIDTQSFVATLTATGPSPSGTGSCVQVTAATFAL
jgi:hypothetical protein